MNTKNFVDNFSEAYFNRNEIMGNAVVTYNATDDNFSWQSSLVPLQSGEVVVATIEDGMIGPAETMEEIEHLVEFFYLDDPDVVREIENKIAEAKDEISD